MFQRLVLCLIISFLTLLTACGFRLRGMEAIPAWLNNVAIVNEQVQKESVPLLKDELEGYGILVNSDPSRATYLLTLEKDNMQEQLTNVSASTTPRQYQLIYTLQFSLIKVKGQPIISSQHVTVFRQLTINNEQILGSEMEKATLKQEMQREAIRQLMNRIARLHPPA